MEPVKLFRKWNEGRSYTAEEAWMAGYAAGCHRGYRKGHGEGHKAGERERDVLLAALLEVLRLQPELSEQFRHRRVNDVRDDGYLLHKLLMGGRRDEFEPDGGRLTLASGGEGK